MSEELSRNIAAWATEVATEAARLPSREARVNLLATRYRELMRSARAQGMGEGDARALAVSCLEGAAKVLEALLARGGSGPQGNA